MSIFRIAGSLLLALALMVLAGAAAITPVHAADPLKILIINSWAQDIPWSQQFMQGFESANKASGVPTELYVEYLDSARFNSPADQSEFIDRMEAKYSTIELDYVVAESLPAATTLDEHPDFLEDVPRVAVTSGAAAVTTADVTVPVKSDYVASIEEMLRVGNPSELVVIADSQSPGGQERLEEFTAALQEVAPDLPVRFDVNESVSHSAESLAQLPPDAAVYYLLVFQDADGTPASPFTTLQQLSDASTAPIFSNWGVLAGHGLVGGYLISPIRVGEVTWDTINALNTGQPVPEVQAADTYRYVYDWRQLDRFNLASAELQAGTDLRFYQSTFWEKNSLVIIITLTVLAVLALLSLLLAVTNRRLSRQQEILESAVVDRTAKLASANKELEQFAYVASHDLRAPLRTIGSFAELLAADIEDGVVTEEVRESLQEITGGVERMQALIGALLDYSRLGGESPPSVQKVGDSVDAALRLVQADLDEADAKLVIEIPSELSWSVGDSFVSSGLVNVIQNSIKYRSPDRVLELEIGARAVNETIAFTVTDNGTGIAPDQLDRATNMFQRLTTEHDGLGIGLASVQRTVKLNNGTLQLDSDGHSYTTVRIEISKV